MDYDAFSIEQYCLSKVYFAQHHFHPTLNTIICSRDSPLLPFLDHPAFRFQDTYAPYQGWKETGLYKIRDLMTRGRPRQGMSYMTSFRVLNTPGLSR